MKGGRLQHRSPTAFLSGAFLWAASLMVAFFTIAYGLQQPNQVQVSPRLSVEIWETGSGQVIYSFDEWGGGTFSFNGVTSADNDGNLPFTTHPEGYGVFEIFGGVVEVGPEEFNPRGWVSLFAWMRTTFRWRSISPDPAIVPEGTVLPSSLGFVEFAEAEARVDLEGRGSAMGSVTTPIVAASVEVSGVHHHVQHQDFQREAVIKVVGISSGYGDEAVDVNGLVQCEANNTGNASATAKARTGLIVLAGIPQPLNPDYYPLIDPLGVPEVGDNEYVFHPITNQLIIPVGARICAGFNPDDSLLQWLAPKLSWELSPSLPVPNPEYPLPNGCEGDLIFPQTLDIYGIKWRGLVFWTGQYLPATNGGFGRRQVVMKFNGNFVHAANVEIFFPATAINHPPLGNDEGSGNPPDEGWQFIGNTAAWVIKSPNWFYYYWMAAYWGNFTIRYADSDTSFYYDGDRYVHIGNNAYLSRTLPLFRLVGGIVTYVDALDVKGILRFIVAAEHELAHKRHYEAGIYPQTPDTDGDRLSDDWEMAHGLDPTMKDTTGAYPDDPDGDLDCIADIEAYGKLLTQRDLWRQDWANTGLQKGLPPFNPMPWRYWSSGTNISAFNDLLQAIP
jgi:hypothetical protein